MALQSRTETRERRRLMIYLSAWSLLGGGALLYLALLVTHPESMIARRGPVPASEQEGNFGERAVMRLRAELQELKQTIGDLRRDIGGMKTGLAERDEREKATADRVAALESRAGAVAQASIPAPAAPAALSRQAARTAARPAAEPVSVPARGELPKAVLETGSLVGEPLPRATEPAGEVAVPQGFGVATVIPARKSAGIRLAAGPSVDALRLSWSLLLDRHKGVLQPLEPRYTVEPGGAHELIAGPFKSQADAQRACATLRSRGVPCASGNFDGETL